MRIFVVLDTNVLVSALLTQNGNAAKVLEHALSRNVVPVLNDEIIYEYEDVLTRDKFDFPMRQVEKLIKDLSDCGIILNRTATDDLVKDPKDVVFYEVTLTAKEHHDAFLVTGNIKDFPVKPFVVTPREMLDIIESAADSNRYGA